MAALLAGQAVATVAREYNISRETVRRWQQYCTKHYRSKSDINADKLAGLIGEYLYESLTTLAAQVRLLRDADWLRQQGVSEIGLTHAILFDKAIRILEAVERAGAGEQEATTGDLDALPGPADGCPLQ
jgi:transposase-like protein